MVHFTIQHFATLYWLAFCRVLLLRSCFASCLTVWLSVVRKTCSRLLVAGCISKTKRIGLAEHTVGRFALCLGRLLLPKRSLVQSCVAFVDSLPTSFVSLASGVQSCCARFPCCCCTGDAPFPKGRYMNPSLPSSYLPVGACNQRGGYDKHGLCPLPHSKHSSEPSFKATCLILSPWTIELPQHRITF